MSGKRRRTLTEGERWLWARVSSTFKPLKRRNVDVLARSNDPDAGDAAFAEAMMRPADKVLPALNPFHPERTPPAKPAGRRKPAERANQAKLPPLASLERKALRAVRRGVTPVDAVLDLHGMRRTEAHYALISFLRRSQANGASLVLIVTGKGEADSGFHSGPDERGVLKRVVPQWLGMPEARAFVVSFGEAAQHHGGTGALYVRLRRARF